MESNVMPPSDRPSTRELKGTHIMSTQDSPRNWKDAPSAVQSAYTLATLGMALYGVLTLMGLVGAAYDVTRLHTILLPVPTLLMPIFFGALTYLNIHLLRRHRSGDPSVWRSQSVISIFCLLGFPLLTVLHLLVLARWFQPETKAWYGIE